MVRLNLLEVTKNGLLDGYCIENYEDYIIEGYYKNGKEIGFWYQRSFLSDTVIVREYEKGRMLIQKEIIANKRTKTSVIN